VFVPVVLLKDQIAAIYKTFVLEQRPSIAIHEGAQYFICKRVEHHQADESKDFHAEL
jgi:hypothetical protein